MVDGKSLAVALADRLRGIAPPDVTIEASDGRIDIRLADAAYGTGSYTAMLVRDMPDAAWAITGAANDALNTLQD